MQLTPTKIPLSDIPNTLEFLKQESSVQMLVLKLQDANHKKHRIMKNLKLKYYARYNNKKLPMLRRKKYRIS